MHTLTIKSPIINDNSSQPDSYSTDSNLLSRPLVFEFCMQQCSPRLQIQKLHMHINFPTGYTARSGNCELIGSLALFNFTPGLFLPFNSKSVDVFHHPQRLEFRNQSRLSPIMTKDRGLYFVNSSQLFSNSS